MIFRVLTSNTLHRLRTIINHINPRNQYEDRYVVAYSRPVTYVQLNPSNIGSLGNFEDRAIVYSGRTLYRDSEGAVGSEFFEAKSDGSFVRIH